MNQTRQCPYILKPKYDTGDLCVVTVNATNFAPDATGEQDAAPAIQEALNACETLGGGTVYLPEGRYALRSPLRIPPAVTLRGEWIDPNREPNRGRGTILCAYFGKGEDVNTPLITMPCCTGLKNLFIYYPEQSLPFPTPYSPTFYQGGGDNITLENVTLVNPWQGGQSGPHGTELHYLKQVSMTPLHEGYFMDRVTDIGRLQEVHIGPKYWTEFTLTPDDAPMPKAQADAVKRYLLDRVTGVTMARSDWEYVYNVYIDHCHIGFKIIPSPSGTSNAQYSGVHLHNCFIGVFLSRMNHVGLSLTDSTITADIPGLYAALYCEQEFHTVAMMNGVDIKGPYPFAVVHHGIGWLSFCNCRFEGWTDTAIVQQSGALTLTQCSFGEGRHVTLCENILSAQIHGCTFEGTEQITVSEAARAHLQYSATPLNLPVAPRGGHKYKPTPCRPAVDILYYAPDYGVTTNPDVDNTAALQQALDAAGQTGGVVFLPGGWYRVDGRLHVPDGVEMRGVFEVPSHTMGGGSVLRTTHGHGDENAAPFLTMGEGAGIRGLVIQHPNQDVKAPVAYPWAVQSRGKNDYAIDVVFVNSWLGLDFGTYPSDGHYISYLGGAPIRCGVFVGNCAGEGWVENIQYNTHYWPRSDFENRPQGEDWRIHWHNQIDLLEALVFGHCENEHVLGTFVFGSRIGIKFMLQNGRGMTGKVIGHGTDGAEISLLYEGCEAVDLINTELVAMESPKPRMYILSEPEATGKMRLFNSLLWGPTNYGFILKGGNLHTQQTNFVNGGNQHVTIEGGINDLTVNYFDHRIRQVLVNGGETSMRGNFSRCWPQDGPLERDPALDVVVNDGTFHEELSWAYTQF